MILLYLQGGPSHLDLWDPKTDVPDNVKSVFKPINTKLPGISFTEVLPKLAKVNDKFTMIRSMSYTPIGLFNHTAAIYQMLTGYTADNVSPSGQLEPPSPKDFPNFGCNIIKQRPPEVPMLPYVMMPRPLQESNVIGKAGTAGFLGRAYDPYYLYPPGDDLDQAKMDHISIDDLVLRKDVPLARLERRAHLRDMVNASLGDLDRAVKSYALDQYYDKALSLVLSGRARDAFNLKAEKKETQERYGRNTFGQCCLLGPPPGRGGNARGRGQLAEGRELRPPFLGRARRSLGANEKRELADARRGAFGPHRRPRRAGHAQGNARGRGRRIRPQSEARRQHVGQLQHRRRARPLALLLHGRCRGCRRQAGLRLRQVGQDGFRPGREPRASDGTARDHLPQRGNGPAADDLQPPQPAARNGEGRPDHGDFGLTDRACDCQDIVLVRGTRRRPRRCRLAS